MALAIPDRLVALDQSENINKDRFVYSFIGLSNFIPIVFSDEKAYVVRVSRQWRFDAVKTMNMND